MKVVVAMSGGADSSACALLLKQSGHDVLGVHISALDDWKPLWAQAKIAAKGVGVGIERIDLRDQFQKLVITPFVQEYSRARTPSPCPLCNRDIKMGLLLERYIGKDFQAIATGHYARIARTEHGPSLLRGIDKAKDQSYFLFTLPRNALERLLLPMGEITKARAREILKENGVPVWDKEESQDICFLKGDYRDFIAKRGVESKPGPIINKSGHVLGEHTGAPNYTIGQRRGLGVCAERPLYVIRIDPLDNSIMVGFKEDTLVKEFTITGFNNLLHRNLEQGDSFQVQVRYRAKPVQARIKSINGDNLIIELENPASAVAAGQAAVFYQGDRVIGGGWIDQATHISISQCNVENRL